MRIHDLHSRLAACGAQPCHSGRIIRAWLNGQPLDSGPRNRPPQDYFPLAVRAALPQLGEEFAALARLRSEHPGVVGSARRLVEVRDREMVDVQGNQTLKRVFRFKNFNQALAFVNRVGELAEAE